MVHTPGQLHGKGQSNHVPVIIARVTYHEIHLNKGPAKDRGFTVDITLQFH